MHCRGDKSKYLQNATLKGGKYRKKTLFFCFHNMFTRALTLKKFIYIEQTKSQIYYFIVLLMHMRPDRAKVYRFYYAFALMHLR